MFWTKDYEIRGWTPTMGLHDTYYCKLRKTIGTLERIYRWHWQR